MTNFSAAVRPLYLYVACLVSLVVFIIGTVTIGNELLRRYVFGLKTEWYENPKASCEYILTSEELPVEIFDRHGMAKPVRVDAEPLTDLSPEERRERYDRCVEHREEDIEMRSKYQLANRVSTGLTMILVALPIFWLHWRIVEREKKKA